MSLEGLAASFFGAIAMVPGLLLGIGASTPRSSQLVSPPEPLIPYVVAPGGSDSNPCSATAPCASFARAYQVAAPGQLVEVAAGSYPPQRIPFDPGKSGSARVVFQPAAGASVKIQPTGLAWGSALEITAHHVQVENIYIGDRWAVDGGAVDVELDNVSAPRFYIGSASNVAVHGGDFGPFSDTQGAGGSHIWADSTSSPDPENILIDGISMHDYTIPVGSGYHLDCLTVGGGTNITLLRSRFWNCNGFDAWTKPFPKNYGTNGLTFFNNVFGANLGGTPQIVSFACADGGSTLDRIVFSYNSVAGTATVGTVPFPCTLAGTGVMFRANILSEINPANCGVAGFTTSYNIVRQYPCARTDRGYSNSVFWGNMPDFTGCSPAIGHGDPKAYPRRDARGVLRARGKLPDAGAYENGIIKGCRFGRHR